MLYSILRKWPFEAQIQPEPARLLQAFYLLASIAALSVNAIPALRHRLLLYGARQTDSSPSNKSNIEKKSSHSAILDLVSKLQVPHSWFVHFYIASVASSLFWAYQICTYGSAFEVIAKYSAIFGSVAAMNGAFYSSMTINQVVITWGLMLLQGGRRLYECVTLGKPSAAKMPVVSWALGICFYVAVGISVWVEGCPSLTHGTLSLYRIEISKPSWKTFIAVPLFILGSGVQHDCHEHLANLQKYTLPDHYFFKTLLCPHYTAECIIYLALTIVSAPLGQYINKTMAMALFFTFANLALTAETTREWYALKFGAEKIKGRWRMIPFVY